MYKELKKLIINAYAPYSHFKVSAIVLTDKGRFGGVNVENAAYGSTICAERNAICSAISNGVKKFYELHLLSSSPQICFPCGVCLQVMCEFFDKNTRIVLYTSKGKKSTFYLNDLLKNKFINVKPKR